MADALFDLEPVTAPEPGRKLGTDARRTIRQAGALTLGHHPLGFASLHPDAPAADDRKAPGPRCGTCAFIERNYRGYLKCVSGRTGEIGTPSFRSGPWETHGPATDLRAWWPGCAAWQERRD